MFTKPVFAEVIRASAFKKVEVGESEFGFAVVPRVVLLQFVFLEIDKRAVSAMVPLT